MQYSIAIIEHDVEDSLIQQRASDGFVNATALCKAAGKQVYDYLRLGTTEAFLKELASETGIPVSGLAIVVKGGEPELQGTWVHPQVAINLGQWCSPKFAVAVSKWVLDWMAGKVKGRLPVHIERYMANREAIPKTHFSMLNELTFALVAPLEAEGYTLPEKLVPDISTGKMFCAFLRERGHDPDQMPSYEHRFNDGRVVSARLYPNQLLPEFRDFFASIWLPKRSEAYFKERDPNALVYLPKLLPAPAGMSLKRTG